MSLSKKPGPATVGDRVAHVSAEGYSTYGFRWVLRWIFLCITFKHVVSQFDMHRRKTESTGARRQPSPLPELGVTPRKSLGFRVQGLRFKEQGSSVVQKMPDLCDSRRASPAPNSV